MKEWLCAIGIVISFSLLILFLLGPAYALGAFAVWLGLNHLWGVGLGAAIVMVFLLVGMLEKAKTDPF